MDDLEAKDVTGRNTNNENVARPSRIISDLLQMKKKNLVELRVLYMSPKHKQGCRFYSSTICH